MAYDLRAVGVDLRDIFREGTTLTPRYLLMLAGQMPEQSAFAAAHRGGSEFRPWTSQTYLLAAITNLLYAANRQRGGRPTRKPMVSPPDASKKARKITVAQLLAQTADLDKQS